MAGVTWMNWFTILAMSITSLYVWQVFKRQQMKQKKMALKPVPIERKQRNR